MRAESTRESRTESKKDITDRKDRSAERGGMCGLPWTCKRPRGCSSDVSHQSAIEGYCMLHGIKLVRVCKDVISGGKDVRPGLAEALSTLQRSADILVVLKFDRLCVPRS